MAHSAQSSDPLERYAAIERAYCEERWMAVVQDGQTLLDELERAEQLPPEGLRERLQLLVAHAYLYGLGDRDSAEDLYQAVLRSGAEASLRQIADQGLQQCAVPVSVVESWGTTETAVETARDAEAAEVGGWSLSELDRTGDASSKAAGSASAPPAGLEISGAVPAREEPGSIVSPLQSDPATAAAPGWLTAVGNAGSAAAAGTPVMPWLESQPAGDASSSASVHTGFEASPEPLPEQLAPALAAPQVGLPTLSEVIASAQASQAAGEAAVSPENSEQLRAGQVPVEAASQLLQSPAPRQSDQPGTAEPLQAQHSPVQVDVPEEAGEALDGVVIPTPLISELPLVADVVEEPELLELYQADSGRQQELLVEEQEPTFPTDHPRAEQANPVEPLEAGDAVTPERSGLHEQPYDAPEDRRAEPDVEDAPAITPARPVVRQGRGLFSSPPEPVVEEDPELLMGLLKVEMG